MIAGSFGSNTAISARDHETRPGSPRVVAAAPVAPPAATPPCSPAWPCPAASVKRFVVGTFLVPHPEHPDDPAVDQASWEGGLLQQHERCGGSPSSASVSSMKP